MADHYWNYGAAASAPPRSSSDRGHIPKASFPGYIQSEMPNFGYDPYNSAIDLRSGSSDFLLKDVVPSRPRTYGLDDIADVRAEPSYKGYVPSSSEDPDLVARYRDVVPGVGPGIHDVGYERAKSIKRPDGDPAPAAESNILFVDGLPTDCTRRELGHLFRPFIGFKEIRVVHKEPRRHGDKAMVLCFVEFTDAKCAFTALEALQGYKFDDKKPESPLLKIHFAHFPFRLPSNQDEQRFGASQ